MQALPPPPPPPAHAGHRGGRLWRRGWIGGDQTFGKCWEHPPGRRQWWWIREGSTFIFGFTGESEAGKVSRWQEFLSPSTPRDAPRHGFVPIATRELCECWNFIHIPPCLACTVGLIILTLPSSQVLRVTKAEALELLVLRQLSLSFIEAQKASLGLSPLSGFWDQSGRRALWTSGLVCRMNVEVSRWQFEVARESEICEGPHTCLKEGLVGRVCANRAHPGAWARLHC